MVTKEKILSILETVTDPEIPVLTIADLGILKDVELIDDQILVKITPTYNGCPAMDMITVNIKSALQEYGYNNVKVELSISPAWTTDWMTEEGKRKLEEYGIAPPVEKTSDKSFLMGESKTVPCPLCKSENTKLVSQFGSTACKAHYQCNDCLEPFDYFKCY